VAHVDKTISMTRDAAGQAYDLQATPATGMNDGDAPSARAGYSDRRAASLEDR
jgi:hypothetical protein